MYSCDFCEMWCLVRVGDNWWVEFWTRPCIIWNRRTRLQSVRRASFFFGVRIMLGMNFNYLILWVRVKGQG